MEKLKIKSFNLVIFGGDGDLSKRKILPALYQRYVDGQLNANFKIICIRRKESALNFFDELKAFIPGNEEEKYNFFPKFIAGIQLITIPDASNESYLELKNVIQENPDFALLKKGRAAFVLLARKSLINRLHHLTEFQTN